MVHKVVWTSDKQWSPATGRRPEPLTWSRDSAESGVGWRGRSRLRVRTHIWPDGSTLRTRGQRGVEEISRDVSGQ